MELKKALSTKPNPSQVVNWTKQLGGVQIKSLIGEKYSSLRSEIGRSLIKGRGDFMSSRFFLCVRHYWHSSVFQRRET